MTCFIIMPFETVWDRPDDRRFLDDMMERILQPAAEAAGYQPGRGDDVFSSSTILTDIWHSIQSAEVLIAVLSGNNANVFYELGLAHARGKAVILIADKVQMTQEIAKR